MHVLFTHAAPILHKLYFSSECGIARFFCACACYACIQRSSIILTPRLPLYQISFLSHPPLLC